MRLINVRGKCLEMAGALKSNGDEDLRMPKEKHGLWCGGNLRQEGRIKSGLSRYFAFGRRHPVIGFMQNISDVPFSAILPTAGMRNAFLLNFEVQNARRRVSMAFPFQREAVMA